jgi:rubrerythrin
MTTETKAKPDYLGLLNAISLGESRAGVYLKAWAEVTSDPELKQALTLVAARETTHGEVFRQRIERLGFTLRERDDPTFEEKVRVYGDPNRSDVDKVRYSRRDEQAESGVNDFFASIDARVEDESVDQLTRDTLRWYVHEERDSGELLRAVYNRIEARADGEQRSGSSGGPRASASASAPSIDTQAILDALSEGFSTLQQVLTGLTDALGTREKHKERDKHKDKRGDE